ncbi:hypothetical protein P3S67_001622 [Capsicum chacoense]
MYLPMLEDVWAWERITVLRPQIVGKRGTRNIFPTGLPRGPYATRWFAHLSWTNTSKHVLKVYRDALGSMTEDQFIWETYTDDLIESLPDYCRAGRDMWRVRVSIFYWDVIEVQLPDRVMRERHIHSMVDKAKSLGDTPSYEDLYMFRKMVRDQSSDCLRYVHEANRIQVSADYRRDGVQPDQERAIARDQVPDEMNEMDEAMKNSQIGSEDDQTTTNHDFGSTLMGCTQEFTQALGIQSAPNFTLSLVPMSIDIPDTTNNFENLNTEMEDNDLDNTNNEVNGNDPEDASTGCEMTIQHDELSKKEKRKIIAKLCGTGIITSVARGKFHTKDHQGRH